MQRDPATVVLVEPLGGVLAFDVEVLSQNLSCHRARSEADHAVASVIGAPCSLEGMHRRRLTRPGGADQQVELTSRRADFRKGLGLAVAE